MLTTIIRNTLFSILFVSLLTCPLIASEEVPLSIEPQDCIDCHMLSTPGIVKDWLSSKHAKITPLEAYSAEIGPFVPFQSGHLFQLKPATPYRSEATLG